MLFLSIIVPIYKVERFIDQCLGSILNEKTNGIAFEIVCVNDGTPDDSMAIVNRYAERFSNVKILNQENKGLSIARNNGLGIAEGEYIWFVDSDDWLSDDAIINLLKAIDEQPMADIIASPIVWKHNSGDVIDWNENSHACSGLEYLKRGMYYTPVQRFIIKRKFLLQSGILFYPHIYHEDVLFSTELLYAAQFVYYFNEPMYQYRQNTNSIMHTTNIKNAYDLITVHQQMMRYMTEHIADKDREWWQRFALSMFEESYSIAWNLRGTDEYKKYMEKTAYYRKKQCDDAAQFGGLKWKIKCWLFKHPMINKYRRMASC